MSEVAAPATPAAPTSTPAAPSSTPSAPTSQAAPSSGIPETGANGGANTSKLPHQDASAPPTETPAQTEARKLKFKGKVNGKDIEREMSEDEANLYWQKGFAADEKFNEAANIRKQFASFIENFKKDPFAAVKDPELAKHFGEVDLLEMAGKRLYEMLEAEEQQKADPAKYELEQYKKRVADYEAKEKAAQESARKQAEDAHYEKLREQTEKAWVAELEKAGLAGSRAFVLQMAQIGKEFLDNGLDLNPAHIVTELKNRMSEQKKVVMSGLKGKDLASFLGDDVVSELLNWKLEEIKSKKVSQEPIKTPDPIQAAKGDETEAKMPRAARSLRSMRDWLADE